MEKLKIERNKANLNQREMAKKLGISQAAYSAYELEIHNPPIDILIKLSELYNVSLDYLITGKEFNINKKSNIEELYNQLTDRQKQRALDFINGMIIANNDNIEYSQKIN